jgi:hypothetical protein
LPPTQTKDQKEEPFLEKMIASQTVKKGPFGKKLGSVLLKNPILTGLIVLKKFATSSNWGSIVKAVSVK